MKQGKLIIVAAHRLNAIKDFGQIIVLNYGKVEEEGTHGKLIMNKGLYYNIFMIQERDVDDYSVNKLKDYPGQKRC